ncbi:hypothetical protein O181_091529 [Austropuccinia psidii MF-1]|uniref:Uncharacterized protein n=1 Tax=Austropuccinia psidii MF-1 TaxID=1389203 RepID=A0A9Q3IXR8_9BASI|nr:hypothetical protein [Austropuccinia psidii MF-1]
MKTSFKYAKERWDKSHKPPDFKVQDLVLVSTLNLNNIKGQKKIKYSFSGPSMIRALNGPNAVKLEFTGELMNKHSTFPLVLIKTFISSDKELFLQRNKPPFVIFPLEEGEERRIVKFLKESSTSNRKEREYFVRYRNPAQKDEGLLVKDRTNSFNLQGGFIHEKRPN